MNKRQDYLKEYVSYLFYITKTDITFDSFVIDTSERETSIYFINGFIEWCKLNYNLNLTYLEAFQIYASYSKYNPTQGNRFKITKQTMETMFDIGLINRIKYNQNNETISRTEIRKPINKTKYKK
jgi:hypothetical protein